MTTTRTPPVALGDPVKTNFYTGDEDVVRRVTDVQRDPTYGSGWRVSADDGGICPCCNRARSMPLTDVDGAHFAPPHGSVGVIKAEKEM